MNRRDFIEQGVKFTGAGLISASLLGRVNYRDQFPDNYSGLTNANDWTNFRMVIDINTVQPYDSIEASSPTVIKDGSVYKMWYQGSDGTFNRIIYAHSNDGISWNNFQLSVNFGAEGNYDAVTVTQPCVINDNGVGKMWYTGSDGVNGRIIYCESR